MTSKPERTEVLVYTVKEEKRESEREWKRVVYIEDNQDEEVSWNCLCRNSVLVLFITTSKESAK